MYNKGLFHPWVPKSIQLLLIFIMTIPVLAINGIYTANVTNMYSDLGVPVEDLMFAFYANTIGMILAYGILFKVMSHFRGKELLVGSFVIVACLSLIISQTENSLVIIACSFLMGFFKMFAMIKLIIPIMLIISPTGERAKFYAVFYPVAIGFGQLAAYLTTLVAYNLDWRYVYIIAAIILFVCALICIIFMHNKRAGKQITMEGIDWFSMTLLAISALLLDYLLSYTKQQGWFTSSNIQFATIAFFVVVGLFLLRQILAKNPYLPLKVFGTRNVASGMVIILLMGVFLGAGSLQTAFTTILGYDSSTNALLNLSMLPGIILGGIMSNYWRKKDWSMKSILFIAFLCFQVYAVMMYFLVASVIQIEYLILPNAIKGLGMCLVFIGCSLYLVNKLSAAEIIPVLSIYILFRTFVGTAFFGAIISWAMYKLQLQGISDLASGMDAMDPFAALRGGGMKLYQNVQVQSTLISIKEIFGYISVGGMLILTFILLHPFEHMHHRKLILARKRFKGYSVKGYREHGKPEPEVSSAEAAMPASGV